MLLQLKQQFLMLERKLQANQVKDFELKTTRIKMKPYPMQHCLSQISIGTPENILNPVLKTQNPTPANVLKPV